MTGSDGHRVVVELLRFSVSEGLVNWRAQEGVLRGDETPDGRARLLAGVSDSPPAGVVLHSTSWRHSGARLVLTYALFPDLDPAAPGESVGSHLVTGRGPVHPAPERVEVAHVAAHAIRHLADLALDRDPYIAACRRTLPAAWNVLVDQARQVHAHLSPAG